MTTGQSVLLVFASSLSLLGLPGCQREADTEPAAPTENSADLLLVRVPLEPDEQRRLGLSIAPLAAAAYEERIEGQAIVLDAQPVVELMASWTAAEAAARQSGAARERASALFGADAAASREALEAAERQAATDSAALEVARAQAMLAYGSTAPWRDATERARRMAELRDGEAVIVRASFPGRRAGELPPELVLRALGIGSDDEQRAVTELWFGPADPDVPGSALLAYVRPADGLVAGARLGAALASGGGLEGVIVPASAVVIAGGSAWCYRALGDDGFLRTAVDLDRPLAGGYFQSSGFTAGDEVVVAGAGLLLAHELSGTEAED